jgi:hypothetical protein
MLLVIMAMGTGTEMRMLMVMVANMRRGTNLTTTRSPVEESANA